MFGKIKRYFSTEKQRERYLERMIKSRSAAKLADAIFDGGPDKMDALKELVRLSIKEERLGLARVGSPYLAIITTRNRTWPQRYFGQ